MAALAVIEQGAVYSTWCTSTWWAHVWYLVGKALRSFPGFFRMLPVLIVTALAIADGWISLPFDEHWRVYIAQHNVSLRISPSEKQITMETALSESNNMEEIKKQATPSGAYSVIPIVSEGAPKSTRSSRQMLVVVSVSMDDKCSPRWKTGLRLLFRVGGVTIYVFSTSIFASVSLPALPMAQMVLMVVIGAGYFSRATFQGLVLVRCKETPIMHLIAEDKDTANRMMATIMQMQSEDSSSSYVFEVDGKVWAQQVCIKLTKRWKKRLFGSFAEIP